MTRTPTQELYLDAARAFSDELVRHMERVFAAHGGRREGCFDPRLTPAHTPEYFAAAEKRDEAYRAMVGE